MEAGKVDRTIKEERTKACVIKADGHQSREGLIMSRIKGRAINRDVVPGDHGGEDYACGEQKRGVRD
jgi:hypothetical protein